MSSDLWAKAHGATTHFPLALALCSVAFDATGYLLGRWPAGRELRQVGYWTMALGSVSSLPAVISGLMMTRGVVMGHGLLRLHHGFVWPAFGLLIALGTWRVVGGPGATRGAFAAYLALAGVASGLLLTAAYWGGEMMLAR